MSRNKLPEYPGDATDTMNGGGSHCRMCISKQVLFRRKIFVIIIALSLQPVVLLNEEMGASHVVPLKIGPNTLYLQNIKLLL